MDIEIGPSTRVMPRPRSQSSAVLSSVAAMASSSASKKPNMPVPGPMPCSTGISSARWSICAEMRPTGWPSRRAKKSCTEACSKNGFLAGSTSSSSSDRNCGIKLGTRAAKVRPRSTNVARSRFPVLPLFDRGRISILLPCMAIIPFHGCSGRVSSCLGTVAVVKHGLFNEGRSIGWPLAGMTLHKFTVRPFN